MEMRPRRYRVYAVTFVLMALGVLSQWFLLNGHIPFSRSARIHSRSGLEVPGGMEGQRGSWASGRNEDPGAEIRPRRPEFQTGVIFPQWGANAYSAADPNWQIALKDIQQQTGAGWIELPINFYQSSITSTQVMTTTQTPTVEAVAAGIHTARAKGYHVFVIPLLSVEEADILSWSGSIQFASQQQTQAWFDSYWQAFQPYVVASAQAGADELAPGIQNPPQVVYLIPGIMERLLYHQPDLIVPGISHYEVVALLIDRNAMSSKACSYLRQCILVGKRNHERLQAHCVLRCRSRTTRLPGIQPDMMMVATCAQKKGTWHTRSDVKPQDRVVKAFGLWDIARAQVDVSNARPSWEHFPGKRVAFAFLHQGVEIKGIGRHLYHAILATPRCAWTIPVDFKTVAVGIREIEGFADQVVGLADLDAGLCETQENSS